MDRIRLGSEGTLGIPAIAADTLLTFTQTLECNGASMPQEVLRLRADGQWEMQGEVIDPIFAACLAVHLCRSQEGVQACPSVSN